MRYFRFTGSISATKAPYEAKPEQNYAALFAVLPTIALVILTAVLGAGLLRHQGLGLAMKIRSEVEAGKVPGRDLANGAMMLVAGVLLLTPGFVTDTLGFLLFIPQVRTRVFEFFAKRIKFVMPNEGARPFDSSTIDLDAGDYERKDGTGSQNSDSPWNNTKH
jgi:UPF0716 protein FxsA